MANNGHIMALEAALEALIDYRGKSPPKSASGTPVISAKVVKNGQILRPIEQTIDPDYYHVWMRRGYPQAGDVVLTTEGPLGEVAQLDAETCTFAIGQRVVVLRGKPEILDNGFLKYLLISPDQQRVLASFGTGTTVEGISQKSLRSLPISLPPLDEQRVIAHILGTLDDKIELNRRMSATLEEMARALFKSWFVDFDPVRAKAEGRPTGPPPEIDPLFPDSFQESALGEIPAGWEIGTLGDLAILNPESWTKSTFPASIQYVDLSNTKWGRIESVTHYNREDAPSRAQRILRPGDTIVGTVRPGNGAYAAISEEGLTGSTGFAVLRPRSQSAVEFVYLAATDRDNIEALSHLADGGAYPAVRPDVVMSTPIIRAHEAVVTCFSKIVGPWLAKLAANERESHTLTALRDTLLPKLLSGALPISNGD